MGSSPTGATKMSRFEQPPYTGAEPQPNLQGCGCIVIPLTLLTNTLAELKNSFQRMRFRRQKDVLQQAQQFIDSDE